MKKIYNIFSILFVLLLIQSCDKKDDFVNENSKAVEVAGDWFVQHNHHVYGIDPWGLGFTNDITFNTSSDIADSIWLSDEGHFWNFKVKLPCDVTKLTFGGSDTAISVTGKSIKVVVRNGKILKAASLQPSGVKADSIYYEVWFENLEDHPTMGTGIPNDTVIVSGFRRTGFVEDEH